MSSSCRIGTRDLSVNQLLVSFPYQLGGPVVNLFFIVEWPRKTQYSCTKGLECAAINQTLWRRYILTSVLSRPEIFSGVVNPSAISWAAIALVSIVMSAQSRCASRWARNFPCNIALASSSAFSPQSMLGKFPLFLSSATYAWCSERVFGQIKNRLNKERTRNGGALDHISQYLSDISHK